MSPDKKKAEAQRYLVRAALISARKSQAHKGEMKQYYFETGKKTKQRTPTRGYFEFNFDQATDMKEAVTLFTELVEVSKGKEIELILEFKEKNKSHMKVDEVVSSIKMGLKVGDKRQIFTINDDNLELKVSLAIVQSQL